jgi:hypothetical protein
LFTVAIEAVEIVVVLSISEVVGIVAVSVKQPHAQDICVLSAYFEKHAG